MSPKKLVVTIEASEWTQEQADNFVTWLDEQLYIGNMGTDDDAEIVSYKLEE